MANPETPTTPNETPAEGDLRVWWMTKFGAPLHSEPGHIPMPDTDNGWVVPAPWLCNRTTHHIRNMHQWGVSQTAAIASAEQSRAKAIRELENLIAEWRAVKLIPKEWRLEDAENE